MFEIYLFIMDQENKAPDTVLAFLHSKAPKEEFEPSLANRAILFNRMCVCASDNELHMLLPVCCIRVRFIGPQSYSLHVHASRWECCIVQVACLTC